VGRINELRTSRSGLLVGLTAASVGVISGYDVSSIGGALLYITDGFHLATKQQELVTTAVVIGEIAGALGGGVFANAIGRKHSMLVMATAYAVFAVVSAVSVSVPMLVVARLLVGVAIGVSFVVVPVYIAESAPAKVRGFLLVSYQLAIVVGIVFGYLTAYLLAGWQSWRWMLGLAAVPALLVMVLLRRLSDTARWYMLKGRVADASHALQRIEPDTDVEKELVEITEALEEDRGGALAEMLQRPYLRATVFVVGLGFLSQATGINAIVSYGPRLLEKMGYSGNFALLILPAAVQVIALAAVFVSMELVDRLGRRPVLLSGIAMMGGANLLLIGVFVIGGAFRALGLLAVLLCTIGYNVGFGALICVYAGESLPSRLRSIGSGAMLAADRVGNAIVAGVFLTTLHSLGGAGTFAVFGVLAVGSFVFVYRLAPETKGRQLEDIRHFWEDGGKRPTEQTAAL
jgi:SP family galactose:H+ symporter-like MFS transporter